MGPSHCLSAAIALATLTAPLSADVATIGASRDNTLFQESGNLSNGKGPYMFAGVPGVLTPRRALIRFDIAGGIPAGSHIDSVSLVLHMSRSAAGPAPFTLNAVFADWGEGASNSGDPGGGGDLAQAGDATWTDRFYLADPPRLWATPGGDFNPTPSATLMVGADVAFYTFASTPELTADVQFWLDNPAANLGWILRGDETAIMTAKRFDSRENPVVAFRPQLVINYTPPAAGGCNAVDIASIGELAPPYHPDHLVTIEDLDALLGGFVGRLLRAGGSAPPPQTPGAYYADIASIGELVAPYHPDGNLTIEDLDAGFTLFVSRAGCP